ncbi:MAG: helix-turn-helix transcriptional regulator [Chloroflexi bacterium]|nr:helix-turn-helix transcriptional regulator [Chloroflexota bacterium]
MPTQQAENGFDIKRLKELRARAGLTQVQLGERAGVHPIQICFFETGRVKKPHARTMAKLCAALSACFPDGLPQEGMYADGLRRAACPHCWAPNCHTLEVCIPGIELQCVSCSRVFRLDENGRAYVPAPPKPTTPHDRPSYARDMSPEARANISAGQRKRHAREREENARAHD